MSQAEEQKPQGSKKFTEEDKIQILMGGREVGANLLKAAMEQGQDKHERQVLVAQAAYAAVHVLATHVINHVQNGSKVSLATYLEEIKSQVNKEIEFLCDDENAEAVYISMTTGEKKQAQ